MDNRKQQAQRLYMEGKAQKEIAAAVGISERTVFTWIHQYAWDKLRLASYQAPVTIADNLCSQLVELQNYIAAREPGKRFPTAEEAEISRKLIGSIEKMKKYPSLSQNMQVLETFRNYIRPIDKDFARSLANYTERFLNGKSINGFAPYQVEYCVDPISPVAAFYDEQEEESGSKPEACCPDTNTCLHPGKCSYPHCQHPEQYAKQPEPTIVYAVPPICYEETGNRRDGKSSVSHMHDTATTGSIPAILQPEDAKNTIITIPQIDNNTSPIPLSTPAITGLPAAGTGSIPATPQPKNVKNIRIALPEINKRSRSHYHKHKSSK